MVDDSDWPSKRLRNALEQLSSDFHAIILARLREPLPDLVWHYTNQVGARGILSTRRLWLKSSLHMQDRQEVHWGNTLVCAAAFRLDERLGGHPAFDALLDDHTASLFLNEPEIFIGCFTGCADDPSHWRARAPDGAALVFDSEVLSTSSRVSSVSTTQLLRVQYDRATVLDIAARYYQQVLDVTNELDAPVKPSTWRFIAQWLMETGFLAFFAKRRSWAWENEFRLVGRNIFGNKEIHERPRRLELDLQPGALKSIVLGAHALPAFETEVRALVATHWAGEPITIEGQADPAG